MNADNWIFEPAAQPFLAVADGRRLPIRRVFCIGKNYADHVREMGGDPKSDPPVFFTKPADAVTASGGVIPYPPGTDDLHFEGELVVALAKGGAGIKSEADAADLVFGYAAGCDLTRRDLQADAKRRGAPWDTAKAFDYSAPIGTLAPAANLASGFAVTARLRVMVNGEVRQDTPLSGMIWSVAEIIMALSNLFELKVGDLIYTGTPAGVGAVLPGDVVAVTVSGLPALEFTIGEKTAHGSGRKEGKR